MARVTVEDCVLLVPNRFDLVLMAAQRARQIAEGAPLALDRDDDKNPVVALREIAEERLSLPDLRDRLIRGHQRREEPEQPEEEITDLMADEHGWVHASDNSLDDDDRSMSEAEEGITEDDDIATEMDSNPGAAFPMTEDDVAGIDADGDVGP